jgi:predicted flap endonuclease-1-like 5' DNA nuclease
LVLHPASRSTHPGHTVGGVYRLAHLGPVVEERLQTFTSTSTELQTQTRKLQSSLDGKTSELNALVASQQSLHGQKEKLAAEAAEAKSLAEKAAAEKRSVEANAKAEAERAASASKELAAKLAAAEAASVRLEADVRTLTTERDHSKTEVLRLTSEHELSARDSARIASERDQTAAEIARLSAELEHAAQHRLSMQAELAAARSATATATQSASHTDCEAQLQAANARLAELEVELSTARTTAAPLSAASSFSGAVSRSAHTEPSMATPHGASAGAPESAGTGAITPAVDASGAAVDSTEPPGFVDTTETPATLETASWARAKDGEDDLELIEGIGPKSAEILRAAGITRFVHITQHTTEELQAVLAAGGITLAPSILTWHKQTKFILDNDEPGFRVYTKWLDAGVEPASNGN